MKDDCILIVEDDAVAQLTLAQYLQDLGFPCSVAVNNGRDAMKTIEENAVVLAFLDVRIMGAWDGVVTAQHIHEKQPDLPLVFLTANTDRTTIARIRDVHPYSIIRKPYDRQTLLDTLQGALRHQVVPEAQPEELSLPSLPIFSTPDIGISLTDAQGVIVSVNQEFCRIHRCIPSEAVGHTFTDYFPEDIRKFAQMLHREFIEGRTEEGGGEWTVIDQYGNPREVTTTISRLSLNEKQPYKITTFVDDSPRKKSAEELRKLIEEKDAFAREIHHRVKNNLNVISGLFYLQAEKIKDRPEVYSLFQESITRIKTMSIIHEQLYTYENYATIDLSKYIPLLTDTIRSTFQDNDYILLNTDITSIPLDVDQAVACGLVINEVLTNCYKYAFARRPSDAAISVQGSVHQDTVTLTVKDNGVGLPEDVAIEETNTLGFQLAKTLAEQLNGTLEVQSVPQQGTSVCLMFPYEKSLTG